MRIVDEAKKRIEEILEGKEDERIMKKEVASEDEEKKDRILLKKDETKEEWYGIHVSGEIHGKRIVKSLGLVYVTAMTSSDNKQVKENLDSLIKDLTIQAQKKGANAIINLRFAMGSYDHDWSQWSVMQPVIYGEAVIVE